MMNKNKYLQIDLYNGKSEWLSETDFIHSIVGDEFDGQDKKGYFMTYKNEDGTIDKEYYSWRDNWNFIRRTPTHNTYVGEEVMIVDFTKHNFGGSWLKEAK